MYKRVYSNIIFFIKTSSIKHIQFSLVSFIYVFLFLRYSHKKHQTKTRYHYFISFDHILSFILENIQNTTVYASIKTYVGWTMNHLHYWKALCWKACRFSHFHRVICFSIASLHDYLFLRKTGC